MEHIYKGAPVVLVLDNALMQIYSRELTPEEIAIQIACSAWARRLWTLQESMYQQRVFYRFADAVHVLPFLNDTVRQQHSFPGRRRSVPPGHHLRDILDNAPHCNKPDKPLKKNAHKALSFWPIIATFFNQIDIMSSRLGDYHYRVIWDVVRSMMTRTTSKIEDESLVFASATSRLGGTTGALLDVHASERYRAFFKPRHGARNLPGHLIFLDQRRYDELGSRWIPRSLLTQEVASDDLSRLPLPGDNGIAWPEGGISVRFPGFVLTERPTDLPFPPLFTIVVGEHDYVCRVYEAGTQRLILDAHLQCPALVLQRDARKQWRESTAVLVEIQNWPEVLAGSRETPETPYNLSNSKSLKRYGKLMNLHIKARHEGLVKMTPSETSDSLEVPRVDAKPIILEKSTFETQPALAGQPRWLVL